MRSIGDLANDVAAWLYEARLPVAIVSVALLVVLVVAAIRLGWVAAAGRHPARTGLVVVAALVVMLPIGWYLGSPIFIRTSLVEPVPLPAASVPPPATSSSPSGAPGVASPTPASSPAPPAVDATEPAAPPTPSAFVPTTLATGSFVGTDDFHFGRGTASMVEIEPGRYHLRLDDFSVRNGPDLYVYLSPDPAGWTEDAFEVGKLKATDGAFGYDLPAGTDPSRFRSALIWCKQFSHLFATAAFAEG
jgi:hypothetical protein